jgi:hypothetical protein
MVTVIANINFHGHLTENEGAYVLIQTTNNLEGSMWPCKGFPKVKIAIGIALLNHDKTM